MEKNLLLNLVSEDAIRKKDPHFCGLRIYVC